jgi:hypothetical protein
MSAMTLITGRDDEFRGTITAIYLSELGRAPDPGGLENWLQHAREGWTGEQIRHAIHESPEAVAFRARPVVAPVHLEIRGRDFVNANGERIVLNGTDAFVAYRLYLDGADLSPLFEESQALGFTMWRVFLMGSIRQNTILQLTDTDPGFYDRLRPFAELLNQHGIILLGTVFVDAQDIMPDVNIRRQHWARVANELRGTHTLLSAGNQWNKNGWHPLDVSDPGGPLWSRGSGVEDVAPMPPHGSFTEFHPVRGIERTLMDAVASPVFLYGHGVNVPLIISEPIGFAEAEQPGRRSADPFVAWQLGRLYATMCAGAVFHSDAGMRGQLMGPVTRASAEAWSRGMGLT